MYFILFNYSNCLNQLISCLLSIINVMTHLNLIFEQQMCALKTGILSIYLNKNLNDTESR